MKRKLFYSVLILCFISLFMLPGSAGADQNYSVPGKNYVLPDTSEYKISDGRLLKDEERFFYGAKSMGMLRVIGAVDGLTTYDELTAYGTNGDVSIHYQYNGSYQYKNGKSWYVDDDGMGKVNGYDFGGLFKGVGHGCIIIEKSSDGKVWDKAQEPVLNYFTEKKDSKTSLIYSIPENEIQNGCYYRVIVAYRFCRKTGDGFMWIGDNYDHKKCLEVYTFYVSSEKNYVTFTDMGNRSTLKDQASTDTGFMIRKNGSDAVVLVNGNEKQCQNYEYFTEPGEYTFDITTKLGKEYSQKITVTNGLNFVSLNPTTYESKKGKGFPLNKMVNNPVFGSSLTSLSLATLKDAEIKQQYSNYGIKGKSISLYLKLNHGITDLGSGWILSDDNWGKNAKDEVCGVSGIGEIKRGALIIQTSRDGKTWNNVDKGRYAKGLYTTDYALYYGNNENVLIYSPSGQDVINGVYVRVLFAYQVYQASTKEYRDYVELYRFYLCSDELGAVTFHNLSVSDTLNDQFTDADQNTIEVYKKAESLEPGSYTATGFQIDKSLNPTVKETITKNGMPIMNAQGNYDETGRYDIKLTSAVGSTREVTIYVDRLTSEEAMQQYFGDGFISGKRIFSEGEYPVYEGGEITYCVKAQEDNVLPLYGQITNISTGSVITIDQSHEEKTGIISEPGEYQAVFATSEKAFTGELTGDAKVFTFHFQVIAQGTAPGPVINQRMLDEYSHSTVTDSNPVYYGLTYSSAEKGHITLAFASKEAAEDYAYNYEKGTVEKQDDGGYRYTGSFIVDQKTKFDSAWDLTDAVNYFAEAAVHKHYFDMSDEFTYLSLRPEVLEANKNLRQLELPRSVTIFADGQQQELTSIDALPLLNDKPYSYLNPETGEEERGFYSFEFVTDQYGGIDSKNVTIIDGEGKVHIIRYSESVGQQLLADNCPSGIVTIHEETMYGDITKYQAVYIAPGENQTELTLVYTQGEENKTIVYTGSDKELGIVADSFTITGLTDPLDPYAFVIVKHNQSEDVYTAKDTIDKVWFDPGEYRIVCINRMGYGYNVPVTITGTAAQNMIEAKVENVSRIEQKKVEAVTTTGLPMAEKHEEQNQQMIRSERQTGDNHLILIISALAILILIAVVIISIYRKGKMYSRMTESFKSEEDENHE